MKTWDSHKYNDFPVLLQLGKNKLNFVINYDEYDKVDGLSSFSSKLSRKMLRNIFFVETQEIF